MDDVIASVRRFSRFYTRQVGALDADFLGMGATLGEARLLFEIAQQERQQQGAPGEAPTASSLQAELGLDAAQMSRMLTSLEAKGWISRGRSAADGRSRPIVLTPSGRDVFAQLDGRQHEAGARMVQRLGPVERADLRAALATAQALLGDGLPMPASIRTFTTGDLGHLAARQSILYAASHGWGRGLEIIEGEVTAAFLRDFKPGREQAWIADSDGLMLGSVLLTDEGDDLARLRLLYVEPFARGHGIGDSLVGTCLGFAREAGYREVVLWTHTVLEPARRLYARHGFVLESRATHEEFGIPVLGETWRLRLAA